MLACATAQLAYHVSNAPAISYLNYGKRKQEASTEYELWWRIISEVGYWHRYAMRQIYG